MLNGEERKEAREQFVHRMMRRRVMQEKDDVVKGEEMDEVWGKSEAV